MKLNTLVILFLFINYCQCAKILAVLTTAVKSHYNVFNSVIEVLGTEHKIDFYSPHPYNRSHENITDKFLLNRFRDSRKRSLMSNVKNFEPYHQFYLLLQFLSEVNHFDVMLGDGELNQAIRSRKQYDLLLVPAVLGESIYKLAEVSGANLVQIATSMAFPWTNAAISNNINLATDTCFFTPEQSNSFFQRLSKFIKQAYIWLYYEWIYLPKIDSLTSVYYPSGVKSIKEISKSTSGVLVNYISAMGYARSNSANVLEIGGLHCKPRKPLPKDLEEFISGSGEHGIIYFSLGSTFTEEILSPQVKKVIINVFKKLPYRIVWKYNGEVDDLPANILSAKWLPQQDILGHNKTKLFITQGGILSLQEAAFHGVQVLILPIIFDQNTNGYVAQKKGYGEVLQMKQFTEKTFYENIQKLINNPMFHLEQYIRITLNVNLSRNESNENYSNNAKLLSSAVKDSTFNTKNRLKQWINFIIEYKNSSFLKPTTEGLSEIQLLELDIYFTIFVLIIATIVFFLFVLLYICKLFQKSIIIKRKLE